MRYLPYRVGRNVRTRAPAAPFDRPGYSQAREDAPYAEPGHAWPRVDCDGVGPVRQPRRVAPRPVVRVAGPELAQHRGGPSGCPVDDGERPAEGSGRAQGRGEGDST